MDKLKVTILYDAVEDEPQNPDEDTPVYKQVLPVLKERGYEVKTIMAGGNIRGLVTAMEKDDSDIVFNLCESLAGEEDRSVNVAALMELLDIRFTGTGSFGMTLCRDKALAKKLFAFHGIKYPKFCSMDAGQLDWSDELKFPLFVKPSNTDSSIGIDDNSLVTNIKELMERLSYIHTEIKAPVLVEEFIEGREIFVGVLGNNESMEAFPIIEWDFSGVKNGVKFATAQAKWDKQSEGYKAPEFFPEDIPEDVYKRIQGAAIDACKALKILDYGRVDMRLRKTGDDWEFFIIEVNPNPYLEERSEVALAAAKHGLSYADLVEKIIDLARQRRR